MHDHLPSTSQHTTVLYDRLVLNVTGRDATKLAPYDHPVSNFLYALAELEADGHLHAAKSPALHDAMQALCDVTMGFWEVRAPHCSWQATSAVLWAAAKLALDDYRGIIGGLEGRCAVLLDAWDPSTCEVVTVGKKKTTVGGFVFVQRIVYAGGTWLTFTFCSCSGMFLCVDVVCVCMHVG